MNPFDQPPTTPPVSLAPADAGEPPAPRRGRMALVAVATAGLMGAGLIGVSQFASADRPQVTPEAAGDAVAAPDTTAPREDEGQGDDGESGDTAPTIDGQIVISGVDGDPIVIDLGEGTIDGESFDQFAECVGLPSLLDGPMFGDLPMGDLPTGEFPPGHMGGFGLDGTHVTVIGPDGLSVVELGDGDGSVTITQKDGEVTIDTDGSATVQEMQDLLGAIGLPDLGSLDLEQLLEDFPLDRMDQLMPEDFGSFEFPDQGKLEECLAAASEG